jgi:tetratricopeptide (TPR) repeat protein
MSLFGRHRLIPLGEMLEEELVEYQALCKSINIDAVERTHGVEAAKQCLRDHCEQVIRRTPEREVRMWMWFALANIYLEEGRVDDVIASCSRASKLHPRDPRPYYILGVAYYSVWNATNSAFLHDHVDEKMVAEAPLEIQEAHRRVAKATEQSPRAFEGFRRAALTMPPDKAAGLALDHFRNTLACSICDADKQRVRRHIRIIESLLNT